ncbi:MAG: IS21 family transposase, partial [Trueperaceae bacterium]
QNHATEYADRRYQLGLFASREVHVVKMSEEIMEILEAYDLTESYRAAGELAGCDHHTVKKYVQLRSAGRSVLQRPERTKAIDWFLDKVEEWVERSEGKIRADRSHEKLVAMGYTGSDRTTRRAVSHAKKLYRQGKLRVYRPWIAEPGLWLQFDWGEGPSIDGRRTNLFCTWLAWSRYRIVIPTWDRSMATVVLCLDRVFRKLGGVPTYVLTDNEKTVTMQHVAGIAVRNPVIAQVGEHYGVTVASCVPADPETKGGSEATVKIAKADLLPLATNLRGEYDTFEQLEAACWAWEARVNGRMHRVTRRTPTAMLLEEQQRLHTVSQQVFMHAIGEERVVTKDSLVLDQHARYSVPHELAQQRARVLVREHGDDVIITHAGDDGLREVARHEKAEPGGLRIIESHYPATPEGPLARSVRPSTGLEKTWVFRSVSGQLIITISGDTPPSSPAPYTTFDNSSTHP